MYMHMYIYLSLSIYIYTFIYINKICVHIYICVYVYGIVPKLIYKNPELAKEHSASIPRGWKPLFVKTVIWWPRAFREVENRCSASIPRALREHSARLKTVTMLLKDVLWKMLLVYPILSLIFVGGTSCQNWPLREHSASIPRAFRQVENRFLKGSLFQVSAFLHNTRFWLTAIYIYVCMYNSIL